MADKPMSQAHRVGAAQRVRRWFGRSAVDALFGADGRDQAVERLLANHPHVGVENVQDGRELLAAQRDDLAVRRVERIGTVLAWGRNGFFLAFALYGIALVVGGMIASESGDSDLIFDELAVKLGVGTAVLVVPMLVLLGIAVLLLWCATSWVHVIALAEVRHAVRWAVDRPGQAARGIPLVAPFRGFAPWLVVPAVVSWVVGGFFFLFSVWLMSEPGNDPVWDLWLAVVALALVGWALLRAWAALKRAIVVANDHVLLLREREYALWVDPATALRERYLLLSEGAFQLTNAEEWTVYPFTTELPPEELRWRRDETNNRSEFSELRLMGAPDQVPVVTRARAEYDDDNSVIGSYFGKEYAGGWVVSEAREEQRGRRAWILVNEAPERFAAEVLPQFGDRTGLEPGSVRFLDQPERVPTQGPWLTHWVKEREAEGSA